MGRLIPAGTGAERYQNIGVQVSKLPGFELNLDLIKDEKPEEEEVAADSES